MAKMSNAKFEVEKFTGKSNFSLWKVKAKDLRVQQGLHKALDGVTKKPTTMTTSNWEDMDARALSTIRLCLAKFSSTLLKRLRRQDCGKNLKTSI